MNQKDADVIKSVVLALKIFEMSKNMENGQVKKFRCPECNGVLRIEKHSENGHIRAVCKNGCIRLIQ